MKFKALTHLVAQNVKRSKKSFLMSGFGIIVGISTFVFFLGLGEGVRNVVLGEIFLVDQVEVVPKRFDTGFTVFSGGRTLDDAVVEELGAIPGVETVFPKMKFTFPTRGHGGKKLFGRQIWAEIIADGLEPELVAADLADPEVFRDWETPIACEADAGCPAGRTCVSGQCAKTTCKYQDRTYLADCPGESYCAKDTNRCEMPIPVIASNHLLELYNGSLATALSGARGGAKMPKLSKATVIGFQLNLTLGKSFLGRAAKSKPLTRRVKLVGFSDKAIMVGMTMPLSYVRRFNDRFAGKEAASTYHSIVLKVDDQTLVPEVVQAVKDAGFDLADSTENAERAANIIRTVESVFALISLVIVGIAAVNISQMFFMIIYQRKREIGVLRAVGANRNDVRFLIMGEAALIGVVGGSLGALVGYGGSRLIDYLATHLPEFPYKPESFFAFPAWIWIAGVGIAVLFCVIGAFFPANTAARQDPSVALTQ